MLIIPEPLLIVLEYLPYGDLLGYLRKSRGHEDTYNSGEKRPTSRLTEKDLLSFAWMVADGMNYLTTMKVHHVSGSINYEVVTVRFYVTALQPYWCPKPILWGRCVVTFVCCNKSAWSFANLRENSLEKRILSKAVYYQGSKSKNI